MIIIEEVISYKIGNKLFKTKQEAENYKYTHLDDLQLGDRVSIKGFTGNPSHKTGIVCCIEDNLIYFAMNGNPPTEHIGYIKNGYRNVKVNGVVYNFDIGCHERNNLIRFTNSHPFLKKEYINL